MTVSPVAVRAETPACRQRAEALAASLELPPAPPAGFAGLLLVVDEAGLALADARHPERHPLRVDFGAGSSARRAAQAGRRSLIGRAAGLKPGFRPLVIDATAGLGQDAFTLAALGCRVHLVERHPVIHALLADGLERAGADPATAPVAERMTLECGEAETLLAERVAALGAQVVYLDPMFPERRKAARVKKAMQLFQALLGTGDEGDALLAAARASGVRRVVVKRPRKAPLLAGAAPDVVFGGKSVRFDVYLHHPG